MNRFRRILLHVACWLGALAAPAWAVLMYETSLPDLLWWKRTYVSASSFVWSALVSLALLLLLVLGIYLCLVAIRKAYFGRGTDPSRGVIRFRTVAVVIVFVLSILPVSLLALACPACLILGIAGIFMGDLLRGLALVGLAIVSGLIPFAIFRISKYTLES